MKKIELITRDGKAISVDNLAAIASHPLLKLGTPVIPFSSLKGEGKNEVWKVICTHADLPTPN